MITDCRYWSGFLLISLLLTLSTTKNIAQTKTNGTVTCPVLQNNVIVDGQWTDDGEWSDGAEIVMESPQVYVRLKHDMNNLYVLVDDVSTSESDASRRHGSKAFIYFDLCHDRASLANKDDVRLGAEWERGRLVATAAMGLGDGRWLTTYLGGFLACSSQVSEKDPYSKKPHVIYEFKIPILLFASSEIVGTRFSAFVVTGNNWSVWPSGSLPERPRGWGALAFSLSSRYKAPLPAVAYRAEREVTIDGRWTTADEWTDSVEIHLGDEHGEVYFRFKHDGKFLYILVDYVSDTLVDYGDRGYDNTWVCIDTAGDRALRPQNDDYGFRIEWVGPTNFNTVMDVGWGGGWPGPYSGHMDKRTLNPKELKGAASTNTTNNPYSAEPHIIYEHQIDLRILGNRSIDDTTIGFHLAVKDLNKRSFFGYPSLAHKDCPASWTDLTFPTLAIPELQAPQIIFTICLAVACLFRRAHIPQKPKRLPTAPKKGEN